MRLSPRLLCAAVLAQKSNWELLRSLVVLKLCSMDVVANNSLRLMQWTMRVRGTRVLLGPLVYDQFVGGETHREALVTCSRLERMRMRPMLAVTLEEDLGQTRAEEVYESNMNRVLDTIQGVASSCIQPMMQLKLSGLLSADLLLHLSEIYKNSPKKLELIIAVAKGLTNNEMDMQPFLTILTIDEQVSLQNAIRRLKKIGEASSKQRVRVLVDAEQTYLNPGMSLLALALASVFNTREPLIWNTYQCYLKAALPSVEEELEVLRERLGCHFGAKVVRGAYMDQERARARALHQPDPVCDSHQDTGNNYDKVIAFLLQEATRQVPTCQMIVATHNEESLEFAIKRMQELNISDENVFFGQLYGMCDHISLALASSGRVVYKSVPLGRVDEVLPYLARRAQENRGVLSRTEAERRALAGELRRRVFRRP